MDVQKYENIHALWSMLFALRHVNKLLPYLQKLAKTKIP